MVDVEDIGSSKALFFIDCAPNYPLDGRPVGTKWMAQLWIVPSLRKKSGFISHLIWGVTPFRYGDSLMILCRSSW